MNTTIIVSVGLAILAWIIVNHVRSYYYDAINEGQFRFLQIMLQEYPSLVNELKQFESSGDVTQREYDIIRKKYKRHQKEEDNQRKKTVRSNRIAAYQSRLKKNKSNPK